MTRLLFIAVLALGLTVPTGGALAHHGRSWTTGGNIDLTGIIRTVRLGNPHGVLEVDVEDEEWTVEVGQPWRNKLAFIAVGVLSALALCRAHGFLLEDAPRPRLVRHAILSTVCWLGALVCGRLIAFAGD